MLEVKNNAIEIKNAFQRLNGRLDMAEKILSEL